jgi:hypothetical protein
VEIVRYFPNRADTTMSLEHRMPKNILVSLQRTAVAILEYPRVGISVGIIANDEAKGVLANWISQCGN